MIDLYSFTKEDERQIRAWTTERLLNLLPSKNDMVLVMTLSNDEFIKLNGKKLAASPEQIERRAEKFIETARDELKKRGINGIDSTDEVPVTRS